MKAVAAAFDAVLAGPRDEHQAAIAENRCCGKNGAEPRCKLCRFSTAYLPALRALRESGRDHFDGRDQPALAVADAPATPPASPLDPVPRLTEAELAETKASAFAGATLREIPIERFVPRDPYRPLDPSAERVQFYEPSYVRGRKP